MDVSVWRIKVVIVWVCIGCVAGNSEIVWVENVKPDMYPRGFTEHGSGPSPLELSIKRGTDTIKLTLDENVRINANAPLYKLIKGINGKQTLVKKDTKPITNVRFYQDKEHTGSFTVKCQQGNRPDCKRLLNGNFFHDGINYDIYPVEKPGKFVRVFSPGHPHVLVRVIIPDQLHRSEEILVEDGIPQLHGNLRGIQLAERLHHGLNVEDGIPPPGNLLNNKLSPNLVKEWKEKIMASTKREGSGKVKYTVESFVVMDPSLWEQHYAVVAASNPADPDAATEETLREYISHIINGVDLRYMSIEDPEMEIFLTLSGFLIVKERAEDNPFPPSKLIRGTGGVEYADHIKFLENAQPWVNDRIGHNNNDHVFIFTGYKLIDTASDSTSVIGVAYVGGICTDQRTSINEDHGYNYWIMTGLVAHELGHNMGSSHDNDQQEGCSEYDNFIMSSIVASSIHPDHYKVNPWRFSQCSIDAFKAQIGKMTNNCLIDHGDYYNETAYNIHISQLPGEIYTLKEQCKLLRGDQSEPCSSTTDETICSRLWCSHTDGFCYSFAAAPGTKCGELNTNKWCYEGLCQDKSSTKETSTNGPSGTETPEAVPETTTQSFRETTTPKDDTKVQTIPPDCEDKGLDYYNCGTMRGWYSTVEGFCKNYGVVCCLTCYQEVDGFEFVPTTTEAPQCEDKGFWGYGCDEMQLWYTSFGQFCDSNKDEYCCATCRDNRIACEDFGFAGISCNTLLQWSRGKPSFCKDWNKYCCKLCTNTA